MAGTSSIVHPEADQVRRKLTQPAAGGLPGAPGLVGDRPCVLITGQDAGGFATVRFTGTARLRVHGMGPTNPAALAENAAVFYDPAPGGGNANINADLTNGVRFGTLVEAVASGAQVDVLVDIHR